MPEKDLNINGDMSSVCMAASFRPRKGAEYLIKAISRVKQRINRIRFFFIGNNDMARNDYLESLRALSKKEGVEEYVDFIDFSFSLRELMGLMDIIVLPSLFGEGCPNVLLEGMALSKALIASNVDGSNEIVVDKETGLPLIVID